jgi:hypothetical protein
MQCKKGEEMTEADVKSYVTKLAQIPNMLDEGDGEARCREIGQEILDRGGFNAMVEVCEYYRDHVDHGRAREIELAWDGIGPWMG